MAGPARVLLVLFGTRGLGRCHGRHALRHGDLPMTSPPMAGVSSTASAAHASRITGSIPGDDGGGGPAHGSLPSARHCAASSPTVLTSVPKALLLPRLPDRTGDGRRNTVAPDVALQPPRQPSAA